jgi:hypothetical protein
MDFGCYFDYTLILRKNLSIYTLYRDILYFEPFKISVGAKSSVDILPNITILDRFHHTRFLMLIINFYHCLILQTCRWSKYPVDIVCHANLMKKLTIRSE